ncbi:Nuclear condensin complex subunit 3 [Gracilaria domingensis]|nr:Nuclear condensin complex subunit 3 [Gracilaria domingensis]
MSSLVDDAINTLSEGLTSADEKIRTIAVQGVSRLLFLRRISPTAKLLSRMLIVYHNPITEDDHLLRQYLSLFFPSFCMVSAINRVILEDAFKPTCNVLLSAPESSPLATVNVVQVAQFILHLTNPASFASRGEQIENIGRPAGLIHERLAETVLNEVVDACENGDEDVCRIYSKILSSFRFEGKQDNHENLNIIKRLAKRAYGECDDRRGKNLIKKFQDRVESALQVSGELIQNNEELDNLNDDDSSDTKFAEHSSASTTLGDTENFEVSMDNTNQKSLASSTRNSIAYQSPKVKGSRDYSDTEPKKKPSIPVIDEDEPDNIVDTENLNDPNFVIDVDNDCNALPITTRKYPKRRRKKVIDFVEID